MAIWKVPRLTSAERLLLTPAQGELLFDTDENDYYGGDGLTPGGIYMGGATNIPFYDSTPAPDSGAGSPGISTNVSRGDHVHPATSGGSLPDGGTAGQFLIKTSSTDGDADWNSRNVIGIGSINTVGALGVENVIASFVNDKIAPGPNQSYGTDANGERGWFARTTTEIYSGVWKFLGSTSLPLNAGSCKRNNTDPLLVNTIWATVIDADSVAQDKLDNLIAGDQLISSLEDNPSDTVQYEITGPIVTSGGSPQYYTIPVAYVSGGGTPPADFTRVNIDFSHSIGASSVLPSDTLPIMDGTASAGDDVEYSRGDHIHPSDTSKVSKAGDTMIGPLNFEGANSAIATIAMIPDPGTPGSDALEINSPEGFIVRSPYTVLDSDNLILTLPAPQLGSSLIIAGVDSFGGAQIGYQAPAPSAYSVQDTKTTPVTIKVAGAPISAGWVDLDLDVLLTVDVLANTATELISVPLVNATTRTGVIELGLRVNGVVNPQVVSQQIPANFDSFISISGPLTAAFHVNDVIELVARVVSNSHDSFELIMDADVGAVATFRFFTSGSSGSGQMLGSAAVKAIFYNSQHIAENLTLASGTNGLSAGPVIVDNGFEVTLSAGTEWSIV